MNFLAHCTLASAHPDLVAGGFLGDFLKGQVPPLPGALALGVRLHRRLDAFSAEEPALRASAQRFGPTLRRCAPIFVDLVADYFLVQQFSQRHGQPVHAFTRQAYQCIAAHQRHMPLAAWGFLQHARTRDLFAAYGDTALLQRNFQRISTRLKQPGLAVAGWEAFLAEEANLAADFDAYYPALLAESRRFLSGRLQLTPAPLLPGAPLPEPRP